MTDKKKDSVRNDIEKSIYDYAMDYVPAGGAAIGYIAARKLGRRAFPYKGKAAGMAKTEGADVSRRYQKAGATIAADVEAGVHLDKYNEILKSQGKKAADQWLKNSGAMDKIAGVERTGTARRVGSAAGTFAGYEAGKHLKSRYEK